MHGRCTMRSLKSVSNIDLTNQLKKMVAQEQDLTITILQFINEVDARGLHLELAYSTITEYCIHELGYGESSAWRRVRVARAIKEIPEVYDLLIQRKISFSAVLQAANALTPDNKAELLPLLIGASKSRIERILAGYQQPLRIPDTAKPRVVMKEVRGTYHRRSSSRSGSVTRAGARSAALTINAATRIISCNSITIRFRSRAAAGVRRTICGCCARSTIATRRSGSTARL
jgi:hypothetical protein